MAAVYSGKGFLPELTFLRKRAQPGFKMSEDHLKPFWGSDTLRQFEFFIVCFH
jgi:hypothetical protein